MDSFEKRPINLTRPTRFIIQPMDLHNKKTNSSSGARLKLTGIEVVKVLVTVQKSVSSLIQEDHLFQTYSTPPGEINSRFDCYDHSLFEFILPEAG